MTDVEAHHQPLIGGQAAVDVPAAQGGRSTRAYKVAGLTLLVCLLIAGQAMVAYFLLSQRSDIKSLEDQGNNLRAQMSKGRSFSVPVQGHMSMNSLPMQIDESMDEEASTGAPDKNVPPQATDCQLEAGGLKPVQVPGFFPTCDERGFYKAQQCLGEFCWCVNPVDGSEVTGSIRRGPASCSGAVVSGRLSQALPLPDVIA